MQSNIVSKPNVLTYAGFWVITELIVAAIVVVAYGIAFLIKGQVEIMYDQILAFMLIPVLLVPLNYLSHWLAYRKTHKEV